jgi:hypothetical protein
MENNSFINMITRDHQLTLSQATPIQSITPTFHCFRAHSNITVPSTNYML